MHHWTLFGPCGSGYIYREGYMFCMEMLKNVVFAIYCSVPSLSVPVAEKTWVYCLMEKIIICRCWRLRRICVFILNLEISTNMLYMYMYIHLYTPHYSFIFQLLCTLSYIIYEFTYIVCINYVLRVIYVLCGLSMRVVNPYEQPSWTTRMDNPYGQPVYGQPAI